MRAGERLQTLLRSRYLDRLLAAPRGRAFFLRRAAQAEDSDEGRFFDELEARVDDDELRKMIRIHRDDELRHARLFAEAADRTGEPVVPIPAHLDLVPRIDAELGGFFATLTGDRTGVMAAYLLLQVLEERAVDQFSLMAPIARRHAPAIADLLEEIIGDEERHLKYCRAIARRYAPDAATLDRTLARFRAVENRVFVEHGRDSIEYTLSQGLIEVGPVEAAAWRGFLRLVKRLPVEPEPTRFGAVAAAA